jgi:hypothetical protein
MKAKHKLYMFIYIKAGGIDSTDLDVTLYNYMAESKAEAWKLMLGYDKETMTCIDCEGVTNPVNLDEDGDDGENWLREGMNYANQRWTLIALLPQSVGVHSMGYGSDG